MSESLILDITEKVGEINDELDGDPESINWQAVRSAAAAIVRAIDAKAPPSAEEFPDPND